jgi:O-antigen/teichoic acid export membrane protein
MLVGVVPYVVSFFMLPIYTRYLTPSDYGILSLVGAFQSMLVIVSSLQISAGLARFYFDYDEEGLKTYFSTVFSSIIVTALLFLLAIHFSGDRLTGFIFPKANIPYKPYFLLALITMFLSNVSGCCNLLLQVSEKGFIILRIAILSILAGIGFGLYFVVIKEMGAFGSLLGNACSGFVNVCLLLYAVRAYFALSFSYSMLKKTLVYSLPIIPHAIGGYVFMYSDRIILEKFVSLGAIGLYNIADRISMILKLVVNSFNTANSPNFMRLSKQDKSKAKEVYKVIITKWAVVISVIFLALAFFSEELVQIMTPKRYHPAYKFIPILLGAYLFRGLYCFAANSIFFEKKTKVIPIITLTAGLINIGLNIIFIPLIGTIGAAWATLVSFIVTFLLALRLSNKYYALEYEWGTLFRLGILTLGTFLIVFFAAPNIYWLKILFKFCGVGVVSLIIYKRDYGNISADLRLGSEYILRKTAFINFASLLRK